VSLSKFLSELKLLTTKVYVLPGYAKFDGHEVFDVNDKMLRSLLHASRVIKTPPEIEYLRVASIVIIELIDNVVCILT
jgi:Xaa-Pro aminopeptidase